MKLKRVKPGSRVRLRDEDAARPDGIPDKEELERRMGVLGHQLATLQAALYAESKRALLVVFQARDAGGKDGAIKRVFGPLNPQGSYVASFRAPTADELAHDYLWRVHASLPGRGEIGIFNRSHYEDVVAVRILQLVPDEVWTRRPHHIVEWERMLVDEGTTLVKVFLNVSKEEQRQRLQERLDDPEKRWKFRKADLDVRARFDDYIAAYDDVIEQTSTEHAPWYVVPADRNWVKATAVAALMVDALERMDPQLPEPEEGLEGLVVT